MQHCLTLSKIFTFSAHNCNGSQNVWMWIN